MKGKTSLVILTCILTASLVLALGTVTFSWYQSRISSDKTVDIPADGFIIVGFDEDPKEVDHILSPAVAMPNAIRNGQYIDVLKTYSEGGDPVSYVETVAEKYTYTDTVSFYANPNAEEGTTYDFVLTADAYVKLGEEETKQTINTEREICFNILLDVDYTDESLTDLKDVLVTPEVKIRPEDKFTLVDSATITLKITIWLAQPDELCDPYLISNRLFFEFGIKATPVPPVEQQA